MRKRFTLLAVFMLLALMHSPAQENKEPNIIYRPTDHEISTGVLNLFGEISTSSASARSTVNSSLVNYMPPGFTVGYRYHINNSAIRTGFNFSSGFAQTEKDTINPQETNEYSSFAFYAGYQYGFYHKRSCFYMGMDLIYESMQSEYITDRKPHYYKKETFDKGAFGFRPFIGVRYFISRRISLSTETFFNFRWFTMDSETVNIEDEVTESMHLTGNVMNFGPVGAVSVNFHL